MPILNYTSQVPPEQTAGEIIAMLAKKGAAQIMIDYDENATPVGLKWRTETHRGSISYSMPIRAPAVFEVLTKQNVMPRNEDARMKQAERTAWRIIKEWTAAQMALIETEMVEMEEVFLPYMLSGGVTLYQALQSGEFKALNPPTDLP